MNLVLADNDLDYTSALASRVKRLAPGIQIDCCRNSDELRQLIVKEDLRDKNAVFLFNKHEFTELERLAKTKIWPATWHSCSLIAGSSSQSGEVITFSRYDPASCLLNQIRPLLNETKASMQCEEASFDQQATAFDLLLKTGLWCYVSFDPRHPFGKNIRQQLLQAGRRVIYLPLMPSYLMAAAGRISFGQTIADLLLLLSTNSVKAGDLGRYWQVQPDGALSFRPSERTDDLLSCDPDLVRRLVLLCKEKINQDINKETVGLIDCYCMPANITKVCAVLSDVCEINWADGEDFAACCGQLEARTLLALLPASCRIVHNGTIFNQVEPKNDTSKNIL